MTRRNHRWHFLIATSLLAFWCLGCGSKPASENGQDDPTTNAVSESHDHEHDHAHDDTGPNGGHLVELNGGAYHAEWLHDDEAGKVTVFVLGSDVTANPDLDVTEVLITTKIAGGATSQYTLKSGSSSDGDANTPCFELTDPSLLTAMKIGEGVICTVSITIGGERFEAEIEHHAHGHNH